MFNNLSNMTHINIQKCRKAFIDVISCLPTIALLSLFRSRNFVEHVTDDIWFGRIYANQLDIYVIANMCSAYPQYIEGSYSLQ